MFVDIEHTSRFDDESYDWTEDEVKFGPQNIPDFPDSPDLELPLLSPLGSNSGLPPTPDYGLADFPVQPEVPNGEQVLGSDLVNVNTSMSHSNTQ